MTSTLNKALLAATVLAAFAVGARAWADDFGAQGTNDGSIAYMNQQAANSQLSDPTARDSFRSHGRP